MMTILISVPSPAPILDPIPGSGYGAMKNIRHSAGVMADMLGSTTTGSGAGAGPTRHVVAYEYFGNWWLRFNLRGRLETAFPVLSPITRGRTSWDVFILVIVLYSAVTVPLAFSYGLPHSALLSAVEWTLTALYVVDIAINFRTAHFNDDGNMVCAVFQLSECAVLDRLYSSVPTSGRYMDDLPSP